MESNQGENILFLDIVLPNQFQAISSGNIYKTIHIYIIKTSHIIHLKSHTTKIIHGR